VYSIEPFVRTADDILDEVLRDRRRAERPEPAHKHVWAETSTANPSRPRVGVQGPMLLLRPQFSRTLA
jgi:hypothetical protein